VRYARAGLELRVPDRFVVFVDAAPSPLSRFGVFLTVVPASFVVSVVWVAVDTAVRHSWLGVDWVNHHVWSVACVAMLASVASTVGALVLAAVHCLPAPSKVRYLFRGALVSALCAVLFLPVARWAFTGAAISQHAAATWGPYLVTVAIGATFGGFYAVLLRVLRLQGEGQYWPARLLAAACAGVAGAGVYADLHFYVAIYTKIHTALEVLSFISAASAVAVILREIALRVPRAPTALGVLAALGAGLSTTTLVSGDLIDSVQEELPHVFREPVYVGRELRRLKNLRTFLIEPSSWAGEESAALAEFEELYGLSATEADSTWTTPSFEFASGPECADCNVLVFYVDTLRNDVALDPTVMPNVAKFAEGAMWFDRAYSTGSDTLASLPGLTGGRYDLDEHSPRPDEDLLEVSKRMGFRRVLSIPRSANEFLTKLHPNFEFDERLEVPDYAPHKQGVWGYGAHIPTAGDLVDVTLSWLREHPDQRFLSWVFNFEVHSWRELDESYVVEAAERANLSMEGDEAWRYRAAAAEVDRHFGRLLEGLEQQGLDKNTIVMVVSDHGEALGEWDFWVHGVALWESLVRVPLLIRIPGVSAAKVEAPVSLTDVAPTLIALLASEPPSGLHPYHGTDLLRLASGKIDRAYPMLFVGRRKEKPVRIGILDSKSSYKLVLPLEVGRPELYDTRRASPDAEDLARAEPMRVAKLIDHLVRSPLYPRPPPVEPSTKP
jgi:hypothetical protein